MTIGQSFTMDKVLLESFENVCEWLETEGDCDLHTLKELQQKMKYINGKDSYSSVYQKKKLKERYNDHVYFSELPGQADVICFREIANYIIKQKNNIIKTKQKLTLLWQQQKLSKPRQNRMRFIQQLKK